MLRCGYGDKVLKCDSRGDKRFSAFHAMIDLSFLLDRKVDPVSIEAMYQSYKLTGMDFVYHPKWMTMKGKAPKAVFTKEVGSCYYSILWLLYFDQNPDLLEYAKQFTMFEDQFGRESMNVCQSRTIWEIVTFANNLEAEQLLEKIKE